VKLEGPVPDQPTVAQVAVVHRAGFDADASGALPEVGEVHPGQTAQRNQFGEVQGALVGDGDLRVKLEEPRHRFVKTKQFGLPVHGHHQVEIEVIETGKPALLETQLRDILLEQAALAAAETVFRQLRPLEDDAGGTLDLEQVIREHQHGVRVDGLLGQADQGFCDGLYRAQGTPPYRAQGTPPFSAWLLTGSAGDVSEAQSGGHCRGALSSASTVFQKNWLTNPVQGIKIVIKYSLYSWEVHMSVSSKHLPAEERRVVTVETVVELAGEQNPSEITTAAIAKRMGLTQGALFRHFPNKDDILQAVMEWVAERLLSRIEKAVHAKSSPLAALESMFMAHVDFITEHPGIPRMLFGELQRSEETAPKRMAQTLIRRYGERLNRLLEQGKNCGELDEKLDNEAAATLFIGTIQGLVMQSLIAGDVSHMRRNAPKVFAIYQRGIRSAL